jgi:hypothetical protein
MEHVQAFIGRCPRVVLTVATLAFLLPFAGKAIHIDDPLFIWAGRQMRAHPFNPYGFDVNWYGTTMRMADVTKNPPLACAYIALLSSIFGEREFWLHVGFLAQAWRQCWVPTPWRIAFVGSPFLRRWPHC